MATISEQLTQLQTDKQVLVDNLVAKGVEATSDETFTTLAPKVANIQAGGDISEYINGTVNANQYCAMACVKKLPKIVYNSGSQTQYFFANMRSLEVMPEVEFTDLKYIYASYMFYWCQKLTDISNISKLKDFPVKECNYMFAYTGTSYAYPDISPINQLDFSQCTNLSDMFSQSFIKDINLDIDTSNVTSLYETFNSYNIETITLSDRFDCGKVTSVQYVFGGGSTIALTTINGCLKDLGKAYTKQTENYSAYTLTLLANKLTHDSLMNIINGLYDLNLTYDVANGGTLYRQKLYLGSTNIAKLTEEEIAIATNKGWNVV